MTTPHDNKDNAPQDNSPQDNSSRDNSSREGVPTADLSDSSVVPLSDSADDAELLADAHPDELEGGSIDRMLADAGQRLRQPATAMDGAAIWAAAGTANPKAEATVADVVDIQAARRSVRRMKWLTSAAAVVAVVSLGASAAIATRNSGDDEAQLTSAADTSASGEVGSGADPTATDAQFVASPAALALVRKLPAAPVDPTTEKLAAAVESFASCDALLGNLRQVGAEHVGSRGFNGTNFGPIDATRMRLDTASPVASASEVAGDTVATGYATSGETIGTNIQVAGVDEPDSTKAIGTTVYDLRNNRLRIIDTTKGEVIGRIDLDSGDQKLRSAGASTLLVSGTTVVVFGSESEQSEPVPGDPSASVSSHQYVTVTMIDITDPSKPTQTDRVRIDGGLVSARLVDGEVRMVTGSFLANIGFVMPTSPESIPKALNINRLSVADSTIDMWIPSYSRDGGDPAPLIPCDRVHVPETFAGVSMTSMVSFPATGTFEPQATGLLAPSENLYATADKVTIASTIWVDPAVAQTLAFPAWDSAIHQFGFATDAPSYIGSAVVGGSINNQFSFGEIGDRLAVVSTAGTPWQFGDGAKVDLTIFDQSAAPTKISELADIGSGGWVSGVRFTKTRVVVSTSKPALDGSGTSTNTLRIVDVKDPAAPTAAAALDLNYAPTYLHPITDEKFVTIGSYFDPKPGGEQYERISGLRTALVDTTNPAAPGLTGEWSEQNASSEAERDHHAFLWWPTKKLVAFGMSRWAEIGTSPPPVAALLTVDGSIQEKGLPQPTEVDVPAPCPTVSAEELRSLGASDMVGLSTVLRCDEPVAAGTVEWPGYSCWAVDEGMLKQFGQDPEALKGRIHVCSDAGPPNVSRVMVVDSQIWLNTSESLERLNVDSLASEKVIPIG